jgi:hypothetical protein
MPALMACLTFTCVAFTARGGRAYRLIHAGIKTTALMLIDLRSGFFARIIEPVSAEQLVEPGNP